MGLSSTSESVFSSKKEFNAIQTFANKVYETKFNKISTCIIKVEKYEDQQLTIIEQCIRTCI